ncbi:MAG: hypothetical protein ACRDWA_00465 [Acidimicrobiia bacterium]
MMDHFGRPSSRERAGTDGLELIVGEANPPTGSAMGMPTSMSATAGPNM